MAHSPTQASGHILYSPHTHRKGRPVMTADDGLQHVEVDSARQLHEWLERHHQQMEGVSFVRHRKSTPERYFTHEQFLDELVAFGWTDGIRRKLDESRNRQLASPRRTQPWAKRPPRVRRDVRGISPSVAAAAPGRFVTRPRPGRKPAPGRFGTGLRPTRVTTPAARSPARERAVEQRTPPQRAPGR